jgi:hypothetical protein
MGPKCPKNIPEIKVAWWDMEIRKLAIKYFKESYFK